MYLLDTNVVSEMRKFRSAKVDKTVEAWCAGVRPADLFVSVITLQELEQGVVRMERRDAKQGEMLRAWLENYVVAVYRDRFLPVTVGIARACATLNVPDKRELGDALIAATARFHGLRVVTRNVVHFEGTGVDIVNPWVRKL